MKLEQHQFLVGLNDFVGLAATAVHRTAALLPAGTEASKLAVGLVSQGERLSALITVLMTADPVEDAGDPPKPMPAPGRKGEAPQ